MAAGFNDDDNFESFFETFQTLPVYIKAIEISDIAHNKMDFINEKIDKNLKEFEWVMAKDLVNWIYNNSLIIPTKIGGATSGAPYDLRMENATLIRKAAREIQVNCTSLKGFDLDISDYLNVLRDEVELFRVEFAEWVSTFDPLDYHIDRWGLFNPPGVHYDDEDPDDDFSFDSDEDLDL